VCLFSVKTLFNCNSCLYIQRIKIFAIKGLWNLSICFQFCNIKIKIVNVFMHYNCNLILHAVKPARNECGKTKHIFTRCMFCSVWLYIFQFLLHYHLTSPVSPFPNTFWNGMLFLRHFWHCKFSFREHVTLCLFSFCSFLKEI